MLAPNVVVSNPDLALAVVLGCFVFPFLVVSPFLVVLSPFVIVCCTVCWIQPVRLKIFT